MTIDDVGWRRLASALPHVVWTATVEGSADYFSPYATRFTGLSESALIGVAWLDIVHPDDQAAVQQAWLDGILAQVEQAVEYRFRRHDGVYRWFASQVVAVRDESGRLLAWLGSAVDITELKRREEQHHLALEERTREIWERRQIALRGSQTSIWDYDVHNGEIGPMRLDPYNNLYEARGREGSFPASDFLTALKLLVAPEHHERITVGMKDCLDGKIPSFQAEYRALGYPDGLEHWRMARGLVTRDAAGVPIRFLGTSVDITQLKRAEEEARRNRERLELALLGSKACTWDFELAGGPLASARPNLSNFWELLGYDSTDPPAEPSAGVIAEHAVFAAKAQAFLDGTGSQWETEYRLLHRDGSDRWHLARGVVVRDASGRARRFIGSSIDITDRKQTEQALRESEARFRGMFRNAAVGIVLTNLSGEIVEHNERFASLLGYAEGELIGHSFIAIMSGDDSGAEDVERLRCVVNGELPYFTRDRQYVRKDGSKVWGNITVSVILRDARGTASRIMGVLQDISERKALEAELRRAKEHLEVAIRSSNLSSWEYDMPDGTIEASRETLTNVWESLGYEVPEEFPASVAGAIHPDDLERVIGEITAYLSGQTAGFETEHRVRRRDGTYRWILGRGVAFRDGSGRPIRFVGTSTDVTDMKRIEGELHDARVAAESANRAKDEFLANVSHEIRTPMNAILGMTELALDSSHTDHQRQLLSTVKSAARNLLGIINDLLDFSKIDAGMLTLDKANFSLRASLGDTLRALAVRAQRKGLELVCHVHADVPDALSGDAGRLRQVVMNLVDNAIKFTARGEIRVDVSTAGPEPTSDDLVTLAFTVQDTGIGIARAMQAVIFRAFEQEDTSTTRKFGGTGLGLTIAAQLAALMGGAITVESEPGYGSTFRFTARFARSSKSEGRARWPFAALEDAAVPMIDDHETERQIEVAADTAPVSEPASATLHILIAEDNELNVAVLKELLKQRGHRATFASNGRAALALVEQGGFDLLLLDLHMPEMDGFQVVEGIRRNERDSGQHLPIIALTARASSRDRERSLAAGMDEFLAKPIDERALWAAVDRVVASFPRATPHETRLLDASLISAVCGGTQAVFDRLVEVFRVSVPEQMARARSAFGRRDLLDLGEAAHKLCGTLSAFSTVAGALASSLEESATRNDLQACSELVDRLEAICEGMIEETYVFRFDGPNG
ncbi:MAG: PAS domain S-box protein [Pseudomonadota bacterium]